MGCAGVAIGASVELSPRPRSGLIPNSWPFTRYSVILCRRCHYVCSNCAISRSQAKLLDDSPDNAESPYRTRRTHDNQFPDVDHLFGPGSRRQGSDSKRRSGRALTHFPRRVGPSRMAAVPRGPVRELYPAHTFPLGLRGERAPGMDHEHEGHGWLVLGCAGRTGTGPGERNRFFTGRMVGRRDSNHVPPRFQEAGAGGGSRCAPTRGRDLRHVLGDGQRVHHQRFRRSVFGSRVRGDMSRRAFARAGRSLGGRQRGSVPLELEALHALSWPTQPAPPS